MPHEFDSPTPTTAAPPRVTGDGPRMTDAEARAVIDLWQSEQMGSPEQARPTPADVAEGLGINTEDAVRLLAQVRAEWEAAQQEELARAERAAHLAELRARQAEAEARAARARNDVRAQTRHTLQQTPPDKREVSQDALYRDMLRDNTYWQQKDKGIWILPALLLALLLLGMMVASIWHPLRHNSDFAKEPSSTTCYIDGGHVPCSQYPDAARKTK